MGSIGSGRPPGYGRRLAEDSRPLDVRRLKRSGDFVPGRSIYWEWTVAERSVSDIRIQVLVDQVILTYDYWSGVEREWKATRQVVRLTSTPCHLGGQRPWWLCPDCGRRVAVLYGPFRFYACRNCHQLAYESQREDRFERKARKAQFIRRKLKWPPGILRPPGGKPKGMHWDRYWRLTDAYYRHLHDPIARTSP
jgi:hypothetical protein